MAGSARRRIVRGNVIRHGRSVGLRIGEVALVTAVAVCGWESRRVVPADVAVRACVDHRPDCAGNRSARRQHVRTLQRESGCAVVELSIRPENRVVASGTHGSRESRGNVVRHISADCGGALPRGLVASVTICVCRRKVVVVTRMAIRAGHHFAGGSQLVRTRQRPPRDRVVEHDAGPQRGIVTGGAIRHRKRRARGRVRGIIRLPPSG